MIDNTEIKTPKKKIILRAVIFIVIGALLVLYLNEVFGIAESDTNKQIFNAFYEEEENTIDAVYFGTSASNRYFIGPMAYEETGMTVFTMATMGMPLFFVTNLIEEVEKTQSPKLYIIELRWMLKDKELITDAHIRRVTDSMKYSSNRKDAIEKALEFTEGAEGEISNIDDSPLDYYIPIIKYHSRLTAKNLSYGDLLPGGIKNKTKGYVTSPKTLESVPQKSGVYTQERDSLSPEAEATLTELLDYCDSRDDVDILFVLSPYAIQEEENAKLNTAADMVRERGYDVIDFNTREMTETLGIDWDTDFYNRKHVNFMGAEKYTRYLTDYLSSNYDLEDHRGEDGYESWDEAYSYYCDFVKDGITTQ